MPVSVINPDRLPIETYTVNASVSNTYTKNGVIYTIKEGTPFGITIGGVKQTGTISSGSISTVVFTLPAGTYPSSYSYGSCPAMNGGNITVSSNGEGITFGGITNGCYPPSTTQEQNVANFDIHAPSSVPDGVEFSVSTTNLSPNQSGSAVAPNGVEITNVPLNKTVNLNYQYAGNPVNTTHINGVSESGDYEVILPMPTEPVTGVASVTLNIGGSYLYSQCGEQLKLPSTTTIDITLNGVSKTIPVTETATFTNVPVSWNPKNNEFFTSPITYQYLGCSPVTTQVNLTGQPLNKPITITLGVPANCVPTGAPTPQKAVLSFLPASSVQNGVGYGVTLSPTQSTSAIAPHPCQLEVSPSSSIPITYQYNGCQYETTKVTNANTDCFYSVELPAPSCEPIVGKLPSPPPPPNVLSLDLAYYLILAIVGIGGTAAAVAYLKGKKEGLTK